MFSFLNPFYWLTILFILIGIGATFFYMVAALRQWFIGEKENNAQKRQGALKVLAIALGVLLLFIVLGVSLLNTFTVY
jgi:NADH:ubiquinone oxidoreductase subunit 5 (subunit L)/multisubunit Na+/H+ antiporter MnhA subunit